MKQVSLRVIESIGFDRPGIKWVGLALVLAVSTLLITNLVIIGNPWLAILAGLIVTLLLPGFLVVNLVYEAQTLAWPEKLPVAFVIGIGLLGLPATILVLLQSRLVVLVFISVLANITLGGLYIGWSIRRTGASNDVVKPQTSESLNLLLTSVTILVGTGAILLYLFTASTWSFGDNWAYLLQIQRHLTQPLTILTEHMAGSVGGTDQSAARAWVVLLALLNRVAGSDPVEMYTFYLPPLLLILSLLAFYSLAKTLFANHNAALLAVLTQLLYALSSINTHDWLGRGFFDRIIEDKFLIWFIILPVTTLSMLKYLTSGQKRHFIPVLLSTLALGLTHPLGLMQWGLSLTAFAIIHLWCNPNRRNAKRLTLIFISLFVFLVLPFLQRQLFTASLVRANPEDAFIYAGGLDIQFVLSQTRLWVFSAIKNSYMAHPQLIAHPLTIVAILLTPLLIPHLRQSLAAQYLFSNMVITLIILYNPVTAPLLGRLITPWMLWRISWLLPVALTVAFFLDKIGAWTQKSLGNYTLFIRQRWLWQIMPIFYLLVMGLSLRGYIIEGLFVLQDRQSKMMTRTERDLLTHLAKYVDPDSVIIAEPALNTHIPAFISSVRVLTFRSAVEPDTQEQLNHFYQSKLIDCFHLDFLKQWHTKYIIIRSRNVLAFQFEMLPSNFSLRYQNSDYKLFEVEPAAQPDPIVAGNTYFVQGKWDKAIAEYKRALTLKPEDTLALFGLGQVYELQNRNDEARLAYQRAIAAHPDNVLARLALGQLYASDNKISQAIDQYQTALKQQSEYPALYEALGDLYLRQERVDQAVEQYERAIEFPIGTSDYYLALGDLYRVKGLAGPAITAYQTAIAINPRAQSTRSANLGLGLIFQEVGRIEEAVAAYQHAIDLAPNERTSYVRLATIDSTRDSDQLIGLYESAIRRNLNLAWPHLELGRIYLTENERTN